MTAAGAIAEAGRVALPQTMTKDSHLVLRLLHAGSYLESGFPRWEMTRRKSVRDVGEGLLMPVGPAIAALWDERSQSYAALSRPFEVKARQTVTVAFEVPSKAAHLVAQIQRAGLAKDAAAAEMKVTLQRRERDLAADILVRLADRVYAVWYGIAPGAAELRVETKDSFLDEPQHLAFSAGKIERLFVKLKARPAWAAGAIK